MIHGRVRLDFCDAITGKVKDRIEGDNTFTNAIDSLLNKCPCGADRATLDGTRVTFENQRNFVNSALGGVLLFPGDVTSGANALYEPLDNQPTAYARIGAQDTSDNKTGYFSETDSREISGGYRFVYEWGASFGNGNIKTVCLTNKYGGEAYGKKTYFGGKFHVALPQFQSNYFVKALGFCDGYYYFTTSSDYFGKNAQIRRILIPLSEILINQPEISLANTELVYTNGNVDDTDNRNRIGLDVDGKKIYIMKGKSNVNKTLVSIDLTTSGFPTSSTELINTTDVEWAGGYNDLIATRTESSSKYIYFYVETSSPTTVRKINLSNHADRYDYTIPSGHAGCLFTMTDTNEINGGGFIIDTAGTVHECELSSSSTEMMDRYGVWQGLKIVSGSGAEAYSVGFQVNPYYMASKFVLDSVKTKDNTKTMKLIYEVTHS